MDTSVVLYIHGKGGSPDEAEHYQPLFATRRVVGLDYSSDSPWDAKQEFPKLYDSICGEKTGVTVIANSIGAFFALCSLSDKPIEKAFFVSPVVDMERLISDMMTWAGVHEDELKEKREIKTHLGETLSWEYLRYVRENPIKWDIPTHILYGGKDDLTSYDTISAFAEKTGATLTVMENGEHWFHTKEQMKFLDEWIEKYR